MNNANMPAAPVIVSTTLWPEQSTLTSVGTTGLTKREHFAGLAMQGVMANEEEYPKWSDLARASVAAADALLKALEQDND
jgi:hypothetical protein